MKEGIRVSDIPVKYFVIQSFWNYTVPDPTIGEVAARRDEL
jgi:hypothetical protein